METQRWRIKLIKPNLVKDHSVVIASVGFLLNIANLLQSGGDDISDKSGYDLVRDKVCFKHNISAAELRI